MGSPAGLRPFSWRLFQRVQDLAHLLRVNFLLSSRQSCFGLSPLSLFTKFLISHHQCFLSRSGSFWWSGGTPATVVPSRCARWIASRCRWRRRRPARRPPAGRPRPSSLRSSPTTRGAGPPGAPRSGARSRRRPCGGPRHRPGPSPAAAGTHGASPGTPAHPRPGAANPAWWPAAGRPRSRPSAGGRETPRRAAPPAGTGSRRRLAGRRSGGRGSRRSHAREARPARRRVACPFRQPEGHRSEARGGCTRLVGYAATGAGVEPTTGEPRTRRKSPYRHRAPGCLGRWNQR